MAFEALREQPSAYVDVGASVKEVMFVNTIPFKHRQVRSIDLHHANVIGAALLNMGAVDGMGIEIRFDAGYCYKQLSRYAVPLCGLVPTGQGMQREGQQKARQSGTRKCFP